MKPKTKFKTGFFLFFLYITTSANSFASSIPKGPLFHRNPVLHQYIFFQFYPQRASFSEKSFSFISSLSHSNIIRLRTTNNFNALSDMAVSHLTINPAYKINEFFELSANIGLLTYWGGALDRLVECYHKAFNFPNGQRGFTEPNTVTYLLGSFTTPIVNRDKSTTSFRDSSLMLRYKAFQTGENSSFKNFALSLGAAVEFPTGKKIYGTSNGSYDFGFAVFLEKELLSKKLYLYYLSSIIKPGELKNSKVKMPIKKIKYQNSISFEWIALKSFSLLVQVDHETSPFNAPDDEFLSTPASTLVLGINFLKSTRKKSMWQFIFTEDITHKTTPDFSLQLGVFQEF